MSSAAAKELQAEYKAGRVATKDWILNAKKSIAVRNAAGPPTGAAQVFQRFAYNYGTRHVHTNTAAPLFHMLLITGLTGITWTYFGRHRLKHAAQAAQKGDHHDAHHH